MPMIQVKLSNEESKKVEIYKILNDCKTKQEAIKRIIQENE